MTYVLQIDVEAGKDLARLPRDISQRIFRKMQETKQNPSHYWIKLEGRTDYKLRVGDYRAIADIDHKRKLIQVTKIGHRRVVYDRT
ncbi:MAG: type II toxin-antitoxin system RelE/ParE family toxin [Candidatus Altiarchaeota archaeon]